MAHKIDPEICTGCGTCESMCPMGAISKTQNNVYQINESECVDCQTCWRVCPQKASFGGEKFNLEMALR